MSSNPAGKAFLAVGTIVLCGLSAWFGATYAQPAAAPSAAPGSDRDLKDVLNRLEELERAVMHIERKLEQAADNARAALDLVNESASRSVLGVPQNGAGTAPIQLGTPPKDATPTGVTPTPMTDEEIVADRMKRAEEIARRVWPGVVRNEFGTITGTSQEHDLNRRAKGSLEATATAIHLGLRSDGEAKLREIFTAQWAAYHSEITPILPSGLDGADIPAVTARMKTIWAKTDTQMRESLDEETYKRWINYAEGNRARITMALDDIADGK